MIKMKTTLFLVYSIRTVCHDVLVYLFMSPSILPLQLIIIHPLRPKSRDCFSELCIVHKKKHETSARKTSQSGAGGQQSAD
jgi:hypothetical protein